MNIDKINQIARELVQYFQYEHYSDWLEIRDSEGYKYMKEYYLNDEDELAGLVEEVVDNESGTDIAEEGVHLLDSIAKGITRDLVRDILSYYEDNCKYEFYNKIRVFTNEYLKDDNVNVLLNHPEWIIGCLEEDDNEESYELIDKIHNALDMKVSFTVSELPETEFDDIEESLNESVKEIPSYLPLRRPKIPTGRPVRAVKYANQKKKK